MTDTQKTNENLQDVLDEQELDLVTGGNNEISSGSESFSSALSHSFGAESPKRNSSLKKASRLGASAKAELGATVAGTVAAAGVGLTYGAITGK